MLHAIFIAGSKLMTYNEEELNDSNPRLSCPEVAINQFLDELYPGELDILIARGEVSPMEMELLNVRRQSQKETGKLVPPRKSMWMCLRSLDFLAEEGACMYSYVSIASCS